MSSLADTELIVYLWVGFLLLMLAGLAGVFWWAVRNRQFADQERARFLALESRIPAGDPVRAGDGRDAEKVVPPARNDDNKVISPKEVDGDQSVPSPSRRGTG
ncbi:cbb3-type cytochrome oxidase assembly protein CcoS [Geomesophilobacter sediminis]|uniref:Cbb3-type cytochrome oxidase assembly protein CcoS n=1 Tax=Geomesophilobacter sediminis TaxID=2798584 RepID=A0A8J7IS90_9BACT|nr:cbb3-type cytochrome oxidase assembly protein CcoS [Geomesophilobacter sediminis]MBJ6726094.1 cbb3-type cytochrome oxidase assembly protein CcoS [Geomesophilobacter sediminis]